MPRAAFLSRLTALFTWGDETVPVDAFQAVRLGGPPPNPPGPETPWPETPWPETPGVWGGTPHELTTTGLPFGGMPPHPVCCISSQKRAPSFSAPSIAESGYLGKRTTLELYRGMQRGRRKNIRIQTRPFDPLSSCSRRPCPVPS